MTKLLPSLLILLIACQPSVKTEIPPWVPYDESEELAANAEHESSRMRFQLIQSRTSDKNDLWGVIEPQISDFSEEDYNRLKPLILEQTIPTMQSSIKKGELSYEELTKWYLYRIAKFENDSTKTLHSILAINPNAVEDAKARDKNRKEDDHMIYGMPILLKDNINTDGMPTTAGAHALLRNQTSDAFITTKIKEKGGIILGKSSLSEWANFICSGCPNGYSAVGGQTLNPYGRMVHDTGGSSSGSGVTMAANYAAAAVGTETSGSILSPSSSNSIVGMKPTVGLVSRGGVVPISSTLDTPGPMTRNVTDNAILLSVLAGPDPRDEATGASVIKDYYPEHIYLMEIKQLKLGVITSFLQDSVYSANIEKLRKAGAEMVEITPSGLGLPDFLTLLNADMKADLPAYFDQYGGSDLPVSSVDDVVKYNLEDTLVRRAYNQTLFEGIVADTTAAERLTEIKENLNTIGRTYFDQAMDEYELDAVLSMNNWSAGYAAVAKYPCLTVPMGYTDNGQPMGITFIGKPWSERELYRMGALFEKLTNARKLPDGYD